MRTYTITTRTVPPTDTDPKRVRIRTSEGTDTYTSWDHSLDAPEVHENAAELIAQVENQGATVTVERAEITAMGYVFKVTVA